MIEPKNKPPVDAMLMTKAALAVALRKFETDEHFRRVARSDARDLAEIAAKFAKKVA